LFALVGFAVANLVSHTVSATILVPIAIAMLPAGVGGESLLIPIAVIGIIVSYSMLLPISTPPNAIALSTGLIETPDLLKAGWLVGGIGIAFTLLFGLAVWPWMI
jgi:sodium-dependent dicarboxylate transporter 2/3/5